MVETNLTCNKLEKIIIPDTPEDIINADNNQKHVRYPNLDEEVSYKASDNHVSMSIVPLGNSHSA